MTQDLSRRQFMATGLAAAAIPAGLAATSAPSRSGDMKIGLYTITYLGVWYKGNAIKLPELMRFAQKEGWEGIEFDAKRPHAAPMDLTAEDRKMLKGLSAELNLPISAVSPNCDLSSFVPEQREAMICYVRECIKLTADLGSPICKIFAAWPGVVVRDGLADYRYTRELPDPYPDWAGERWGNVRTALVELCRVAEDHGVVLALQNHEPVITGDDDVLKMIREVGSPVLKACLDHSNPAAVAKAGPLLVHSHFNGEFRKDSNGRLVSTHEVGYEDFVTSLVASGYNGFMNWEFCHPAMQFGQRAGIDYVHSVTRDALQYMKMLRAEAKKSNGIT